MLYFRETAVSLKYGLVRKGKALAEFVLGTFPVLPPTVAAISLLLKKALRQGSGPSAKKKLEGARVTVVGAGRLVGLPVSLWLAQQGAVVSLIQKGTKNSPCEESVYTE